MRGCELVEKRHHRQGRNIEDKIPQSFFPVTVRLAVERYEIE